MKPILENIHHNPSNSFVLSCSANGSTEPFWHIHPEYEIVYIRNGSADQHIGSHCSKYNKGTLLLVGPNLPHSIMSNQDFENNVTVIVQMKNEFLEKKILAFSELLFINELLVRSKQGISFGEKIKNKLGPKIENLENLKSYKRLFELIDILKELTLTNDYTLLNANAINIDQHSNSYYRVNQINNYVAANYQKHIQLIELANLTGLTESSFSRFFKNITGQTFITFLNEYRIHKACTLLSENKSNISEIMYLAGFTEAAHFTRVFKKYTQTTPREYRKKIFQTPYLRNE